MAQKKIKIPLNVLKKFDKVLFNVGDPVIIKWLGGKKQGYVTQTKKTNDGVRYLVESISPYDKKPYRYPCGIQIKNHTTKYDSGVVLYEESKQKARTISENVDRETNAIGNDDTSSGGHDGSNRRKTSKPRNDKSAKNDAKSSTSRVRSNNATTRKDISVDEAVKRQQDFLRGFVKK